MPRTLQRLARPGEYQIGDAPIQAEAAAPDIHANGGSTTAGPLSEALGVMEARATEIRAGTAPELVWLLEHPALYTAGTSAKPADLLVPDRFPVYRSGRGGQYTYHGPGQRVAYVMLDLKRRRRADVRAYVATWRSGSSVPSPGSTSAANAAPGRVGIWVDRGRAGDRGQDRRDWRAHPPMGDASTASPSTSTPTSSISPASCPAASPARPFLTPRYMTTIRCGSSPVAIIGTIHPRSRLSFPVILQPLQSFLRTYCRRA